MTADSKDVLTERWSVMPTEHRRLDSRTLYVVFVEGSDYPLDRIDGPLKEGSFTSVIWHPLRGVGTAYESVALANSSALVTLTTSSKGLLCVLGCDY